MLACSLIDTYYEVYSTVLFSCDPAGHQALSMVDMYFITALHPQLIKSLFCLSKITEFIK